MGRIAEQCKQGAPRTLVIDIETRPGSGYIWGSLFDNNISLAQLIDPGGTMCWAAKWVGERKVYFMSDHHDGHDEMVRGAWDLMDAADVIVHFNGKGFDVKHLHREFVLLGLTPPSPHKDVDLLTVARSRFKFISNKLDHVSEQLGCGSKVKHPGFDLWKGCMAGDEKSWATMKRYNVGDVKLTEAVYERLRPWIKGHPHPGLYGAAADSCPNCGGRLEPNGTHVAASQKYRRLVCVDCGAHARSSIAIRGTATHTRGI
jgi:hypothetical protein